MSGRDVRRVAARASTATHHDKQQQVTRLVLGALEQGVDHVYLADEPFRINSRAIENLEQRDRVTLLNFRLTHTSEDTVAITRAMWEQGCRTFIVLGGDGTSRIVAGTTPDAVILPLSTGTNNVFPYMVEASVAGAAAGIIASGKMSVEAACQRCKQIHVETEGSAHVALVDAVLLKRDLLGSLLPFDPDNIASVVLARAEPASIGMSPIGGYLVPCHHEDDFGVAVVTGEPARHIVRAPVSAGLYGDIPIAGVEKVALDEPVIVKGPGILAFDGDRILRLEAGQSAELTVRRDGPWVINPWQVMEQAVELGLLTGITTAPG